MSKSIVALVPIDTYEQEAVDEAVRKGISLLGGWERFLQRDEKILLKPNLLGKALPQRAVTTHPAVFAAVAKALQDEGYTHLSFGDSPSPASTPQAAAKSCGIADSAEALGIPWADFSGGTTVSFPEGKVCKSFHLANGIVEADAIVNLCKMKTHALERITGAVKNMYGCILGISKGAGHVAYPNSDRFAEMLADLHRCVKPRLHIMDGIVAMEGNGPTSGTPVPMNALLFSADPVALDAVFASLVYLKPSLVPTCVTCEAAGLGCMDAEQIAVLTPDCPMTVSQAQRIYGKPDFDVFRGTLKKSLIAKLLPLLPNLQERPVADPAKCIGCGLCQQACPVPEKAVRSGGGKKAEYDYRKCIRCYCCQEVCPAKAISAHRPALGKLIH